jgi:hypothetical protein
LLCGRFSIGLQEVRLLVNNPKRKSILREPNG